MSESSGHDESSDEPYQHSVVIEVEQSDEKISPVSSNTRRVSLNFYQDLEDLDEEIPETRFKWTREYVEDLVNIICDSDYYRSMLIFTDTPNLKNSYVYAKAVEEANKRIPTHIKHMKTLPNVSQARNKFKKLVSICRHTAKLCSSDAEVEEKKRERGYGRWFDKLFPLVKARDLGQVADYVNNEETEHHDPNAPFTPEIRERLMEAGRVRSKRFTWTHEYTNDLVDIICKSDLYKRKLIHTRNLNARNTTIYKRIVMEMVDRARRHLETVDAYPNAKQARTKFKKLVSMVRKVAATNPSVDEIHSYKDRSGFGRWFLQLYPLVTTREFGQSFESSDVSMVANMSEPPAKRLRTIDIEHLSTSDLTSPSSALNSSVSGCPTRSSVLSTSVNGPVNDVSPESDLETVHVVNPVHHTEEPVCSTPREGLLESTLRINLPTDKHPAGRNYLPATSGHEPTIVNTRSTQLAELRSDDVIRNTDQYGKGSSKRKMSNPTYRRQAEELREDDSEVKDLVRELVSCINTVVQNNPIDKLLAHIAEENKRAREHNLRLFQMLCQLISPSTQRATMQDGHASTLSPHDTISSLAFEAISQQYQNVRGENVLNQSAFTSSQPTSQNQAAGMSPSFSEGQK